MSGIYLHIPYCKQVCYYCDFHFRVAMKDKRAMLDAMKQEIALRKDYLRPPGFEEEKIPAETLYFGGGTPSVLTGGELADLLETLSRYYTLAPDAEITLEANPDDLTDACLADLRRLGFNRLSIGIQSFFDDDLKMMNRRHNGREAEQSVEAARRNGFDNINIDLIYGLPSGDEKRWQANLERAFALNVPHLSAYRLTIEPRTVFGRKQAKGEKFSVSEDIEIREFEMLTEAAENAGFEHYEISNFARPGFRSRHNSAYWQLKPYIGIGPSAHSYDGQSRQWNVNSNGGYIRAVNDGDENLFEREMLSPGEMYNDYVLVSLRAVWGVDVEYIRNRFGAVFSDNFLRQAESYLQTGHIEKHENTFVLSRKGKLIADRIASDLFAEM